MADSSHKTIMSCDGRNQESGHPRVFLNMGKAGKVECPYCGHLFALEERQEFTGKE